MHICYSTDLNYCPHLAASIASLLKHAKAKQEITIHIMHSGCLDEKCQAKFCSLSKLHDNAKIKFLTIKELHNIPKHFYFPKEAFFRIFFARLHPELDKALYLDCDIIVQADLTELYCTDITNYSLAAIPDIADAENKTRLDLKAEGCHYYNSGVLLMNLAKFRDEKLEDKLISFATKHMAQCRFYDQCSINVVLQESILCVHPRWNMQFVDESIPYTQLSEEHANAFAHPSIIHFIGSGVWKPWSRGCKHPYQKNYIEALSLTPWRHQASSLRWNIKRKHMSQRRKAFRRAFKSILATIFRKKKA